jgi:hypothetical protein
MVRERGVPFGTACAFEHAHTAIACSDLDLPTRSSGSAAHTKPQTGALARSGRDSIRDGRTTVQALLFLVVRLCARTLSAGGSLGPGQHAPRRVASSSRFVSTWSAGSVT